jgi:uncharacterized protein YdbL (DUF1318 family)
VGPSPFHRHRWFFLLGCILTSCVSARINVVDERTALENQIIGTYQELDHDLMLLASVRAAVEKSGTPPTFLELRTKAIQARRIQQFQRDDIDEQKTLGCLGEDREGMLAVRPCERSSDASTREATLKLVEKENNARRILLQFVVSSSSDLTQKDLPQVEQAYARLLHEQAKSGEWVQTSSGGWEKK